MVRKYRFNTKRLLFSIHRCQTLQTFLEIHSHVLIIIPIIISARFVEEAIVTPSATLIWVCRFNVSLMYCRILFICIYLAILLRHRINLFCLNIGGGQTCNNPGGTFYDGCNTCGCSPQGTVTFCTLRYCPSGSSLPATRG